jgi:hypothetical protein
MTTLTTAKPTMYPLAVNIDAGITKRTLIPKSKPKTIAKAEAALAV